MGANSPLRGKNTWAIITSKARTAHVFLSQHAPRASTAVCYVPCFLNLISWCSFFNGSINVMTSVNKKAMTTPPHSKMLLASLKAVMLIKMSPNWEVNTTNKNNKPRCNVNWVPHLSHLIGSSKYINDFFRAEIPFFLQCGQRINCLRHITPRLGAKIRGL